MSRLLRIQLAPFGKRRERLNPQMGNKSQLSSWFTFSPLASGFDCKDSTTPLKRGCKSKGWSY